MKKYIKKTRLNNGKMYYFNCSYWIKNIGPQIVSVHGLPRRTKNNIESFHNALRLKFSVAHPSVWVFLGKKILKYTIKINNLIN